MKRRILILTLSLGASLITGIQAQADSRQDAKDTLNATIGSRTQLDKLWRLEETYLSSESRFVILSKEITKRASLSLESIASLEESLNNNPSQIKGYIESELEKIEVNIEDLIQVTQASQKLSDSAMISFKAIVDKSIEDSLVLEQSIAYLAKDFMRRISDQTIKNEQVLSSVKQSFRLAAHKVSRYLIELAAGTSQENLKRSLYQVEAHLSYQAHLSPLIREMRLFDSLLDRQILSFLIFRSEQTLTEMLRLQAHFDDVLASMVLPSAMKQEAARTIEQLISQAHSKLDSLRSLGPNKIDLVLKAKRRSQRLVARECRTPSQKVDCELYDVLIGINSEALRSLPQEVLRQYEFAWDYLRGQVQI
ncbi:hypothetical protein [Pseudobacteriovorax antillogorgiicola]|uniref:Uncharacterized protein n=1 Tax=Pseudobacteriovorax antillogorgiicola TaxID=1513793 RepID=A0A1Y6BF13_9BACT|nr:hypothetical protein [Pseudobacteriovorax antillogorgiicola]TCS56257.1 hypothetical protein EDD56_10479 [Pseudobacteriovorax antillogorgiicola]SMF07921.1 hypothetical protein SAMN06296036_104254 [Pseudobacteriovorax antillogorgiicola]